MKIAVVQSAGSGVANRVLQGVYGSLLRQGESATGVFRFAPEFNRVSHLFSMIQDGAVPVDVNTVVEIDVPDAMANDFKGLLMHELGGRWEKMYEGITPMGGDTVTKALIQAESERVREGVRGHLSAMGLRVFDVTAKVPAQSEWRSGEYDSMHSLARGMKPEDGAQFQLLEVEQSTRRPGQADETAQVAPDQESQDGSRWYFEGHRAAGDLIVKFSVVAGSQENAAAVSNFILNDNSMRGNAIVQNLTSRASHVENVRQGEALVYGNTENDNGDDEGGYQAPRDTY